MNPLPYLQTQDDFERDMWIAIAKEAYEYQKVMQENLAIQIANHVGKLFG